jgi:hypothetical protein
MKTVSRFDLAHREVREVLTRIQQARARAGDGVGLMPTTRSVLLGGTWFTPHWFDDVLLSEPERMAFYIARDHAEACDEHVLWTLGRSIEALAGRRARSEPDALTTAVAATGGAA